MVFFNYRHWVEFANNNMDYFEFVRIGELRTKCQPNS